MGRSLATRLRTSSDSLSLGTRLSRPATSSDNFCPQSETIRANTVLQLTRTQEYLD